jgi:hypothetical protein
MSLLNDLNPEVRKQLEADKVKYPNLYKSAMRELTENNFVMDLSVNIANQLINYADNSGMKFESDSFVLKLYNVFGK